MNAASHDAQPLRGVRVLVTRAQAQAAALCDPLAALGAEVILAPSLRIVPCATPELDQLLLKREAFDCLVLTSTNAVDAFVARLQALRLESRDVRVTHVAAIGAATARRLELHGFAVSLVPPTAVAESLADALVAAGVQGQRVLLPIARVARDVLVPRLEAAGARVERFAMYDTVVDAEGAERLADALKHGAIDVVTFASPSAVDGLAESALTWRSTPLVVCIGPVTAKRARERGWSRVITADEHSMDGLVAAVVRSVASSAQGVAADMAAWKANGRGRGAMDDEGEHA